jgi:hypothetical protein
MAPELRPYDVNAPCPACGVAGAKSKFKNGGGFDSRTGKRFDFILRKCGNCGFGWQELPAYAAEGSEARAAFPDISPKNRMTALLLCIFLGGLGVHRFYAGRTWTGILWLVTGGVLGVGWVVDIILIATGRFRDNNHLPLAQWY